MEMPTLDELSREQADVLALNFDNNWIITGPPGTGKSVMALYRLSRVLQVQKIPKDTKPHEIDENDHARLIVYNRLLSNYIQSNLKALNVPTHFASTYNNFFARYWFKHLAPKNPSTGKKLPIPLIDPTDIFSYDFKAFREICMQENRVNKAARYFMIDEGQDLPNDLYDFVTLMCDHITIFVDENQSIRDRNASTLEEIRLETMIQDEHKLTRNYRNSIPIANFASEIYPGNRDDLPLPPERDGELPEIFQTFTAQETIEDIRKESTAFNKKIGVFVPTVKDAKSYAKELTEKLPNKPVYMYHSKLSKEEKDQITFEEPNGVYVMHYSNAKGLEFDTAFITELQHDRWPRLQDPEGKHLFYVLVSRARSKLFFNYIGDGTPEVIREIQGILERIDY